MKKKKLATVTEVVWPWRQKIQGKSPSVYPRVLIQTAVIMAIASCIYYLEHKIAAYFIWAVAGITYFCSILLPTVYARIEHYGKVLGNFMALVLTWMLLTPFYYLFFWPCALLFRKPNSTNFSSKFPTDADTYWVKRNTRNTSEQYKRQF